MVRWRYCLFLAMLLTLPVRPSSKLEDDDDDAESGQTQEPASEKNEKVGLKKPSITIPYRHGGEIEDDDDDDDDDDEEPSSTKADHVPVGRRAPAVMPMSTAVPESVTRTVPRRPLECYVCAYKAETQLRSCLDPTKYRVHTMICHSAEDKCFTSVISKDNTYEAVMRGCRSGCMVSQETTCCDLNRCNNQALAVPVIAPRALTIVESKPQELKVTKASESKSNKVIPPSILFFVTILLVLQTVVKVAFV